MTSTYSTAAARWPFLQLRSPWVANLALTLPFLCFYWLNLYHHQLWFDEINAWGITCAAPTLERLFALVHFEGHPWLWYVILYLPSRFTHDPATLKWTEGLFGTTIYLVIGLLAPFTRMQKVLVFLSYFVVFEYTVMSRMYSVMFLCALLYVASRMRRPDGMMGNGLLLGVVASTDMTGVLLSGALLLEYIFDRYTVHRAAGWSSASRRGASAGLLAYIALLVLAITSLIPAKGISWQASGKLGAEKFQPRRIMQSVGNLSASPWWPISKDFPHHFWGTDAIENRMLLVLTPIVLFAIWRVLRKDRNLLLLMGLTLSFGMLFADVIYWGRVRHWGIAFVSFLLALWMQASARDRAGDPAAGQWSPWAYGLMGLSAIAGLTAIVGSWNHPFSEAQKTAAWIRANNPPGVPLVGQWDLTFASVGEELQRPMYFMECACTDTFKLFAADRDEFPDEQLPARLTLALKNLNAPRLLLVNWLPLKPADFARLEAAALVAKPLATFDRSDEHHENYYLYSITRRSPAPDPPTASKPLNLTRDE